MRLDSKNIRRRILQMANQCGRNAHIGGSLSMVEILTVLYRDVMKYDAENPQWSERDRFILSKGHCALGLDATLVECGFISEEEAATFLQDGSDFGSHPVMNIAHGIESSNGSLGQGISMAVGIAKAMKITNSCVKTYVLLGNGECNEGSVWEAVMLASQWKLNNLTIIIDNNKMQSDGNSDKVIDLEGLAERFESFGCYTLSVDGHNEAEILNAYLEECGDKPKVIIANTIKGKGIQFMENDNSWHHNRLTDSLYAEAMLNLGE